MAIAAKKNQPILPRTRHWRFEIDLEGTGWLTIDTPDNPVNVLSSAALGELEKLVARFEDLAASGDLAGVVLQSGKAGGFIAGADVSEFDRMADPATLPDMLRSVHALFKRIEELHIPVVAAINGFCLGGGLELALACHYRIAVDNDKVRIGFPEVKLGLFPGFGGTGRSIRQAGPVDAMGIMLSGRYLRAGVAKRLNLVDQLVRHSDQLKWEARKAVQQKRRSARAGVIKRVMAMGRLRGMAVKKMRTETAKKVRPEHYPAPFALIDLFEKHGDDPQAMMAGEVHGFTQVMGTDTATNLRRVFFLSEALKKQGVRGANAPKFRRVHVIGAGVMGGDIAAWCALRGLEVTLQDLDMERIEPALKRAGNLFSKRLKTPRLAAAAEARLVPDVKGHGVARADVIIEAVVEKLEVKHKVFAAIEKKAKPGALLATNTSSIELERIAEVLEAQHRLIGLHFFNPVAQLPLVEVVRSRFNDDLDVQTGASFALAIGKSPLVVKSAPGFLVNRVLVPYMMGAIDRVERGESKELIDAAAVAFGMPMGPIELMDTVGLDIGHSVAGELGEADHESPKFLALVAAGKLGRKTGEGFYRWDKGKAQKQEAPAHDDLAGLGRELLAPLADGCEVAVAKGVVKSADLADIGVILGIGFAPFLGGPLKARRDGKV